MNDKAMRKKIEEYKKQAEGKSQLKRAQLLSRAAELIIRLETKRA